MALLKNLQKMEPLEQRCIILSVIFIIGVFTGILIYTFYDNRITEISPELVTVSVPVYKKKPSIEGLYKNVQTAEFTKTGKLKTLIIAEEVVCVEDKPIFLRHPLIYSYYTDGTVSLVSTSDFGRCEVDKDGEQIKQGKDFRLWGNVKIKRYPPVKTKEKEKK